MLFKHRNFFASFFSFFLFISSFSSSLVQANTYQNYDVFEDSNGEIYLQLPKLFVLIHADVSIPLQVLPHNGLLHIYQENNQWKIEVLTEQQFNALTLYPSDYVPEYIDFSNDGDIEVILRADSVSDDSFILYGLENGNVSFSVHNENKEGGDGIDLSQGSNIAYIDQNGDGYLDIHNQTTGQVYIGSRDDKFINTATIHVPIAGDIVGATGGQFRVAEDGSATYQIPLNLPAGIAGVTPQAALSYSSNGGVGQLGRGWSLSAVTAISRCPKNYMQDEMIAGVSLTITDEYCLNGQRLLLSSGAHGTTNAVYYTEISTFERVTITSSNSKGATSFKVENKSGETHYYGEHSLNSGADAYVGNSSAPQAYLISVIADIKGNRIDYKYDSEQTHTEVNLEEITWGATGHKNKLTINYTPNSRGNYGYRYGAKNGSTQLIASIKVTQEDDLYRFYDFTWDHGQNLVENESRIDAIYECLSYEVTIESGINIESGTDCLSPTRFEWSTPQSGQITTTTCPANDMTCMSQEEWVTQTQTSAYPLLTNNAVGFNKNDYANFTSANTPRYTGDFNGDGLADIAYYKPSLDKWEFLTAKRNIIMQTDGSKREKVTFIKALVGSNVTEESARNARVIDLDGNGKLDLLYNLKTSGAYRNWYVIKNSSNSSYYSTTARTYPLPDSIKLEDYTFLDVDGNSFIDMVYQDDENFKVVYNYRGNFSDSAHNLFNNKTFTATANRVSLHSPEIKNSAFVDFNGDGISDFLARAAVSYKPWHCYGIMQGGQRTPSLGSSDTEAEANIHCASILASGLFQSVEVEEATTSTNTIEIVYLKGKKDVNQHGGFHDPVVLSFLDDNIDLKQDIRIVDFNGDGLSDIVYRESNKWYYVLSEGDDTYTFKKELVGVNGSDINAYSNHIFMDVNGDGKTDILRYLPGSTSKYDIKITKVDINGTVTFIDRGTDIPVKAHDGGFALFADFNGDQQLDFLTFANTNSNTNTYFHLKFNSVRYNQFTDTGLPSRRNVIEGIRYGMGQYTRIKYDHLNNAYLPQETGEDPLSFTNGSYRSYSASFDKTKTYRNEYLIDNTRSWVVSSVINNVYDSHALTEKQVSVSYRYGDMIINKMGRGSLGFTKLQTTDNQTGVITTTKYKQAYPYSGMPASTESIYNNKQLSYSFNTFAQTSHERKGIFPYIKTTTDEGAYYHTDGTTSVASKAVSTFTYDNQGNLTNSVVDNYHSSGFLMKKTTTANEYNGNSGSNVFTSKERGRLSKTTVTHNATIMHESAELAYQNGAPLMSNTAVLSSTFTYNGDGLLATSTVNGLNLKTSYEYTAAGNKRKTCLQDLANTNSAENTRCSTINWSADERYVNSVNDALGNTELYLYNGQTADSVLGRVWNKTTTSANGLVTTQHFDIQGQVFKEVRADGTESTITRAYVNSTNGASCMLNSENLCYYEKAEGDAKPTAYTWYDAFGRKVKTQVKAFDGSQWSSQYMTFDELSRGKTSTIAYFENSPDGLKASSSFDKTEQFYDELGRVTSEKLAGNNGSNFIEYMGDKTKYTDANGTTRYETKNGLGQLSKVQSASFNTRQNNQTHSGIINYTNYFYNVFGKLEQVKNYSSIDTNKKTTIHNIYDNHGRKTDMFDPDKGHWKYEYNSYGELKKQTTSEGGVSEFIYDKLGRKLIQRTQAYDGYDARVACYTYGTSKTLRNVGQAIDIKQFTTTNGNLASFNCSTSATPQWRQTSTFDTLGRPKSTTASFDGKSYTQSQTYDQYSRPLTQTLPEGVVISSEYANNYIKRTRQNGTLLREILSRNAAGQVLTEKIGQGVNRTNTFEDETGRLVKIEVQKGSTYTSNNFAAQIHVLEYSYDNVGNLDSREQSFERALESVDEVFEYDGLYRLKKRDVTFSSFHTSILSAQFDQVYQYDAIGNITRKYNTLTGSDQFSVQNYHYNWQNHSDSTAPYTTANYKLGSITGDVNTRSFTYDKSGNVQSDGLRAYNYTSFDKPYEIISNDGQTSEFWYGPSKSRYMREDHALKNGAWEDYKTHYFGAYERIEKTGSGGTKIEHKYQVAGAIITRVEGESDYTRLFAHKDVQGSVISITDENGDVAEQFIYDPWGKQQKIVVTTTAADALDNMIRGSATTRGYTGHEEISHLELIHMNGRVYDANIGRFLQADPHIQAPNNSQNYNRYSYVLNNPMSYTDPSGYFFSIFKGVNKFVKKYWRTIAAVALAAVGGYYALVALKAGAIGTAYGIAAASGFASGYVSTGSLKGALTGAFTSMAFLGVGQATIGAHNAVKVLSHAVTGGIISDLRGGKFGHGFISAGLTKGAQVGGMISSKLIEGALGSAIVGGTVSKLTGGKFANGAITAAFQFAMNQHIATKFEASVGVKKLFGAIEAEYSTDKGFDARFKSSLEDGGNVDIELDTNGQIKVMGGNGKQIGGTIDGSKHGLDGQIDVKAASFSLSLKPGSDGTLVFEWKVGISGGIFSGAYGEVHQYDMSKLPLFHNFRRYNQPESLQKTGPRSICTGFPSLPSCQ